MVIVRTSLLIAVTAVLLLGEDTRRKLWQLNLAQFVNGRNDLSAVVWGISFSPDESKVAIGFGPISGRGVSLQRVVILSLASPSTALREFEVSLKNWLPSTFAWTPSGSALVVGDRLAAPVILSVGNEPSCTFPEQSQFGGFLSDDRMVISTNDAEIRILRRDCSHLDGWKTAGDTRVLDTSPEMDLIATLSSSADGRSTIQLISGTGKLRLSWFRNAPETTAGFMGGFHFADQGRMFCSGYDSNDDRRANVACWDTQSGAIAARNTGLTLWSGSIRSSGGSLLAITDYNITEHTAKLWRLMDAGGRFVTPRRRVIWNVRTGNEIASWTGQTVKPYFVFALSRNGKYFAEGGSGSLWVYSLPSQI